MARKPDKRIFVLRKRNSKKIHNRKFNPPVRGRKITLQEVNRPILERLAAALEKQG